MSADGNLEASITQLNCVSESFSQNGIENNPTTTTNTSTDDLNDCNEMDDDRNDENEDADEEGSGADNAGSVANDRAADDDDIIGGGGTAADDNGVDDSGSVVDVDADNNNGGGGATADDGADSGSDLADGDDNEDYSAREEISQRFLEGPGMIHSKFLAHQKLGVPSDTTHGFEYFFAATLLGKHHNGHIEFGDMFEDLVFQACVYSKQLDDLQFVFIKHSWLEKCPMTDETSGNFTGTSGIIH